MEKNYDFRNDLIVVHKTSRRDFSLKPQSNETVIDADWQIIINDSSSDYVINIAKDLQDYLFLSMGISLPINKIKTISTLDKIPLKSLVLFTKNDIFNDSTKLQIPRSYQLIVEKDKIIILGNDERGTAQGSYHLEDMMNLREAPFMEEVNTIREPLFSPRMVHSGWGMDEYPDAHLNSITHAGMDAILVFAKGVDLTTNAYLDFNDLVNRAAGYGIDVYFYSYLKSLKHPDETDAEEFYDNTYGALFKHCPGAKGVVLVGESCEFPSKDENTTMKFRKDTPADGVPPTKPSPGWWPCKDYPQWLEVIKKSVRKYTPKADIVFWTYNWGWAPEKDRLKLIKALPEDISLLVTYEMFEQKKRDNATHMCVDYSLSFEGPGEYFKSEAKEASKRGIQLYTMSNTAGLTWDFGVIPYEPFPGQWAKRHSGLLEANKKWGLSGLMESHHYGFYPSFIAELAKWRFWSPSPSPDQILKKIVCRDFGSKSAGLVVKALEIWDEAIRNYIPTNEDQYGPFRVGPAYPFVFRPDISKTFESQNIPFPVASRASNGGGIIKTFYHPFEDSRMSPGSIRMGVELRCLKKMRESLQAGIELLEKAQISAPQNKRKHVEKLLGVGKFMRNSVCTTINIKKWWMISLRLMLEDAPVKAHEHLDELVKIAECEICNANETIPLVEADSRLGWEPSMEYVTDRSHLEWKIRQVRSVLDVSIPKYRESLNLK